MAAAAKPNFVPSQCESHSRMVVVVKFRVNFNLKILIFVACVLMITADSHIKMGMADARDF